MKHKPLDLMRSLGPGLIWAGTAIGVSHLVQATTAGARFSMALLWLVVLANIFKYPGFEAGPRYAAATGRSLLEGYRRLGTWALVLFLVLTVSTMFTVIAAVTIVTSGMAASMVSSAVPVPVYAGGLLLLAAGLLAVGRYRLLDWLMKAMMLLLTVSTLTALALLIPALDLSQLVFQPLVPDVEAGTLIFMCALAGWMPSALDIAVWQSLWSLEKARTQGRTLSVAGSFFDFNVGYIGTAILACAFVLLGAGVLYGNVETLPDSPPAFARLLVDMYAGALDGASPGLGAYARPVILVAAFATMLSTTITVVDGFPRAIEGALARFRGPEGEATPRTWVYWATLVVCVVGAMLIIVALASQLRLLVTIATVLTGLTGALFGVLNLLVIRQPEVPEEHRPSVPYTLFHVGGIVFMAAMGVLLVVGLVMRSMGQ